MPKYIFKAFSDHIISDDRDDLPDFLDSLLLVVREESVLAFRERFKPLKGILQKDSGVFADGIFKEEAV